MARRLSERFHLPLIQVDALEFNSDLSKKPLSAIRESLLEALHKTSWVLDGHGPLDLLPQLLDRAELIVLIDLPLWRHYFWLLKRQLTVLYFPRPELPSGSSEWSWNHFKKLVQTLQKQNKQMKPELLKILHRSQNRNKLRHIQSVKELNQFLSNPDKIFNLKNLT